MKRGSFTKLGGEKDCGRGKEGWQRKQIKGIQGKIIFIIESLYFCIHLKDNCAGHINLI